MHALRFFFISTAVGYVDLFSYIYDRADTAAVSCIYSYYIGIY